MIVEGKRIHLWTRVRFSPAPYYMMTFFMENKTLLFKLFFLCLFLGYLFGSIPVGYLYSKAHGINILKFGSGNPGSTNVGRALGKKHGRIVFFLDIFKIIFPVIIISIIFLNFGSNSFINNTTDNLKKESLLKFFFDFISIYTGLGGILGHNFPVFLHFRGGKGISCTMGAIFCFSIPYSIMLFIVYKIVTKITKYVSVGSLSALTVLLISSIILSQTNVYPFNYSDNVKYGIILLPGILLMWLLGVARHTDNIKRLLNGTENRITE